MGDDDILKIRVERLESRIIDAFNSGDVTSIISFSEQLNKVDDNNAYALAGLAIRELHDEYYADALANADDALGIDPCNREAIVAKLSIIRHTYGSEFLPDQEAAVSFVNEVYDNNSGDSWVLERVLDTTMDALGDRGVAISAFDKMQAVKSVKCCSYIGAVHDPCYSRLKVVNDG